MINGEFVDKQGDYVEKLIFINTFIIRLQTYIGISINAINKASTLL